MSSGRREPGLVAVLRVVERRAQVPHGRTAIAYPD